MNVLPLYFLRKFLPKMLSALLSSNQNFKGEAFFDENIVFIIPVSKINFFSLHGKFCNACMLTQAVCSNWGNF